MAIKAEDVKEHQEVPNGRATVENIRALED
jgi:hypothetical protein